MKNKIEMPFWVYLLLAIGTLLIFVFVMLAVKDDEFRRIAPTPEPTSTPSQRTPRGTPISIAPPTRK